MARRRGVCRAAAPPRSRFAVAGRPSGPMLCARAAADRTANVGPQAPPASAGVGVRATARAQKNGPPKRAVAMRSLANCGAIRTAP
ncbi:DUF6053 domain-containing protein [Lysobacter enzymogenes]|uniref:DUF6053 domain-containing protein n=1 Tax=Lysobacter enzymogenes TaxID=69 RepID=UPI00384E106F